MSQNLLFRDAAVVEVVPSTVRCHSYVSSIDAWHEPLEVEPQAAHIFQSLVSPTKADGLVRLLLVEDNTVYKAP